MTREDLIAAYAAPVRHYHNLAHIQDCLGQLARVDALSASERAILEAAIWWHDVVYDPTRSDNEELSAQLAEQNLGAEMSGEVGRLIRLTRTHQVEPSDKLGGILISIDSRSWRPSRRVTTLTLRPFERSLPMCLMHNIALAAPMCCGDLLPGR